MIVVGLWAVALGVVLFIVLREQPNTAASLSETSYRVDWADAVPAEPTVAAARVRIPPPPAAPPATYRFGPRHTARSPFAGPSSSTVAFKIETDGRITAQAAVAADGTVYVGSHDQHLYALTGHGRLKWKRDLGGRIYSTPHVDGEGHVYVGSDGDAVFSFAADGRLRWKLATSGDADTGLTPAPDGRLVFAAGPAVYAVKLDGTLAWRFEASAKVFAAPAVADDGTIYVGSQDDHFYGLSADGEKRWAYQTGGDNDSSPAIGDDGTVYFGSDDGNVYALRPEGRLRWSTDVGGYVRAPLALTLDGTVLAGVIGPRPAVIALDAVTGGEIWRFPVTVADSPQLGVASGPIVDRDGNIYFGAHDDFLYSLTSGGALRWFFEAGADVDAPPILGPDGTLYVGSDDRHLYAFRSP
jgi:outer membrane protein assembly factor BamB